ncbi:MAG: AMP-binding protein [Desulfobacterales bacterium]|jgi:acetyl-CoA synthetase
MLTPASSYEAVCRAFRWQIPEFYNIGVDICDKWADGSGRLALIYETESGGIERFSFDDLKKRSNRLANAFQHQRIGEKDRVGILLPQRPETAITHIAAYKLGAVAIPLFTLFGTEALQYRLKNSGARAVVTDGANLHKILEIRDELPDLKTVVVAGGKAPEGVLQFERLLEKGRDAFLPKKTRAEDPALIIYTSGTTGPPKGALHAHRVLPGHLPGVEFPHDFFPQKGDRFWTPADWAWIGGLIDVLFPAWHHGVAVVAHRAKKFDPEEAFALLSRHEVRNAFMPPTALKLMRQVKNPANRHSYRMRSIGSGGETLGEGLLQWGWEVMGLTINEFYGQTEANLIVGNCAKVMDVRPGSMGRAVPGHQVAVVDADARPVPPGATGEVAVKTPDPVSFIEYWKNRDATEKKIVNGWLLTGDLARQDEDGYFWYVGRTDDVITSAGYRIGPAEVEDCLMKHPAVAMAAVVGVPDPVRTEVVKAFVVPAPGAATDEDAAAEIRQFVKVRLAAHEYPRQVEFVEKLPMTATGKIMRRKLREQEVARAGGQPKSF